MVSPIKLPFKPHTEPQVERRVESVDQRVARSKEVSVQLTNGGLTELVDADDRAVIGHVEEVSDEAEFRRFTNRPRIINVQIKLVAAGSTWYGCTVVSGNDWTCDTSSPAQTVATMDELEVVATSN